MEHEEFQQAMDEIIPKLNDQIHQWKVVVHNPHYKYMSCRIYKEQSKSDEQQEQEEEIIIVYDILLHPVYKTPAIFIRAQQISGQPLSNTWTLDYLEHISTQPELSPDTHPLLGIPCVSIGACSTWEILSIWSSNTDRLLALINVWGSDIGLV